LAHVQQVKGIVRQWVIDEASRMPGFRGAFFHGSINWLTDDDALPETSDVDVMVVLDGAVVPEKPGKFIYRDVIIEASYLPADQVSSADLVLGMSHLAGSLHKDSIIADPSGKLRAVQHDVAKDYTKREWVIKRCQHAEYKVRQNLSGLDESAPFHDQAMAWLFGAGVTTHILLTAGLKNPTVRRRYLAVRELLVEYSLRALYPSLLEMIGCAEFSQTQARRRLQEMAAAFDAARTVIHSSFPFAADISTIAQPMAVDGSRELIERGDQREAVFWIAVTYSRCQKVLFHDGPAGLFARHNHGYRSLLADMGVRSFADLLQRSQQALDMLPRVWQAAEAIIAANPDIT